ncbi:hypothetical protein PPBDW_I21179 [Photobacterium kishitanii]|nr:hypothetical protein PPBDW_I21179 [Photobacterium kishitanii]
MLKNHIFSKEYIPASTAIHHGDYGFILVYSAGLHRLSLNLIWLKRH